MRFKSLKNKSKKYYTLLISLALSISILSGCSNNSDSSDKAEAKETTTEQITEADSEMIETSSKKDDKTESNKKTTETSTTESKNEKNKKQTTTEVATTEVTTEASKPTTEAPKTTEVAAPVHTHTWTTETYYTTETQTIHHDPITHTEEQTTYTEEEYGRHVYCCDCGRVFDLDDPALFDHIYECPSHGSGCTGVKYETRMVPHTTTVTIVDQEAYDEVVEVQVEHTRTVCSECGATK